MLCRGLSYCCKDKVLKQLLRGAWGSCTVTLLALGTTVHVTSQTEIAVSTEPFYDSMKIK